MSGFRAYHNFANSAAQVGDTFELSADESRHLCGSLRAAENSAVDAFDLGGAIRRCRLERADGKRALLRVEQILPRPRRAADIYLLQCLPKGRTFDDIIRQSVELGAAGIVPIMSRFSQVRLDPSEAERKREKWLTQVVEAVKQSSNFSGFEIAIPTKFDAALDFAENFDLKIVASLEPDAARISALFKSAAAAATAPLRRVAVLIGPEGDMSADEYSAARSRGFKPMTLGDNVLKSETAAISAIAQIKAALDFVSDGD